MANLNETLIIWETTPNSGEWGMLGFDGVVDEGHSGGNVVTSYPVDSGFEVSEHAIRQNRTVSLNAIVSNISFNVATRVQSFREAFEVLTSLVAKAGGSTNQGYDAAAKYGRPKYDNNGFETTVVNLATSEVSDAKVNESFEVIKKLVGDGTLVHCLTIRGWYLNCVMRNYDTKSDVSNVHSLPITLQLEELNVINKIGVSSTTGVTIESLGLEVATSFAIPLGLAAALAVQAADAFEAALYAPAVNPVSDENIDTFTALDHKSVPFSTTHAIEFLYEGAEYTIGALVYSETMGCFVTSLEWRIGSTTNRADGIAIRSGVNLVQQYNTSLPSLVAVNRVDPGADVTSDADSLELYIIVDFEEYFLSVEA